MRIIFVPQYPTPMRYSEWWFWKLPEEFEKAGHKVITLGKDYANIMKHRRGSLDIFSPVNLSIEFETRQIREYIELELEEDDVLFWADISFPGGFGSVLFHKRPPRMYAFCHATSINKFDYFEHFKDEKFMIETALAKSFNKVFVASKYHQDKLGWDNTVVTYLPFPPIQPCKSQVKYCNIISASRPSPQKVDSILEKYVEQHVSQIFRPVPCKYTWDEYFYGLSQAKILLISSFEDTFGYQIIDAIINGCIPIARNGLAYPEILPREYLYESRAELINKLDYIINSGEEVPIPKIICENEMKNFYKRIIKEMEN